MSADNAKMVEIVVPLREEEATRLERAATECGVVTPVTEQEAASFAAAVLRTVCLTSSNNSANRESPAA